MNLNVLLANNEFLTQTEMAERLKVAPKTISAWVRAGRLPKPTRLGRLARWYWPQVLDFLSQGREPLDPRT